MVDPPKTDACRYSNPQKNMPDDCHMHSAYNENTHQSDYLDITAMIRSLQRTEGYEDCFRTGLSDCDQIECAWRQYCLQNQK